MLYKSEYGTYKVEAVRREYPNGNLAVELTMPEEGETYGVLTVNLEPLGKAGLAYVDTNNLPEAEKFIEENELGVFMGLYAESGFCSYPLYRFNLDKLKEAQDE